MPGNNPYPSLAALFTATAQALRARTGASEPVRACDFPAAIAALPSGTDTSDATASASDILAGRTAYGPGGKLTGSIPSLPERTITPGTQSVTLAAGQYLAGAQTVAGEAALVPGNIRAGATVFGVAGSYRALPGIMTPLYSNIRTGWIGSGTWYYNHPNDALSVDIYQLDGGHHYVVGLCSPVGNRFRVAYFSTNPADATANLSGTAVGSDADNPTAFQVKPVFTAQSSMRYLAVFKANNGTGDAAVAFVMDMDAVTRPGEG